LYAAGSRCRGKVRRKEEEVAGRRRRATSTTGEGRPEDGRTAVRYVTWRRRTSVREGGLVRLVGCVHACCPVRPWDACHGPGVTVTPGSTATSRSADRTGHLYEKADVPSCTARTTMSGMPDMPCTASTEVPFLPLLPA